MIIKCPRCEGHLIFLPLSDEILTRKQVVCEKCGTLFTFKDIIRLVIKAVKSEPRKTTLKSTKPIGKSNEQKHSDVLIRLDGPPAIRPWDPKGFNPAKYPKWMGLDPSRIKCRNCLHWDEKDWYCFIKRRRTHEEYYWCYDFTRRM